MTIRTTARTQRFPGKRVAPVGPAVAVPEGIDEVAVAVPLGVDDAGTEVGALEEGGAVP